MAKTTSNSDCNDICTPRGLADPSCGCAGTKPSGKPKRTKYVAGFITLCAICCAVPPALVAIGFTSLATGAYLSAGFAVALIVLAGLGLGYLSVQYVKQKRSGGSS